MFCLFYISVGIFRPVVFKMGDPAICMHRSQLWGFSSAKKMLNIANLHLQSFGPRGTMLVEGLKNFILGFWVLFLTV